MKAISALLLLTLAFSEVEAFTTKKKERRTPFQHPVFPRESALDQQPHEGYTPQPNTKSGGSPIMFAFAPGTSPVQVVQYYDPEEEGEVSYSIALVSCMLSLAVGFGLGYGT